MPLTPGQLLGPYEILAPIGAGGMGEVYRARDTRLDRTVAVKVLPAHLAANPEFRQRFEREAKVISSLNHPHICTLYDVGRQDGIDYLVMEYLEGETLAAHLAQGPLPPEQVVRYGVQIADALDKAHRRGLTHRDLKPGNIMLTAAGAKLLDFGLAKAAATSSPVELSTPTQSLALTAAGTIVGTFQYMSPEQLQGKDADARSDIFAFGAVLYEMLTGRKAFEGVTQATVLGAILHAEPPPVADAALGRIIRRCLAKDPEERWQSARDVMLELREPVMPPSEILTPVRRPPAPKLAWAIAAACFLAAAVLTALHFRPATPPQVLRFTISPPPSTAFFSTPVISPDGTRLAFSVVSGASPVLWVRALDSLTAQALPGTEGAMSPFWSPDNRSVGFVAQGKLKRVDISGGPPQVLADAAPYGGTWNEDGVIVFTPTARSGLMQVSAGGGPATPVTTLDSARGEVSHRWPHFLPDGRHFLYLGTVNTTEGAGVYVTSLDGGSKEAKRLLSGSAPGIYAPGAGPQHGFLLTVEQNTLQARPFDASRREVTGPPFPVAELAGATGFDIWNFAAYSASRTGVLSYIPDLGLASTKLAWFDRGGKHLGNAAQSFRLSHPALSPDEKRVAFELPDPRSGQWDLWITDLSRNVQSRFTFEPSNEQGPVWSTDGRYIFFVANRGGAYRVFRKLASGAGAEEQILESKNWIMPAGVLGDRSLVYHELDQDTKWDLWVLPLTGDRKPVLFLKTPFDELNGQFSPDGRWMAYNSNETGGTEVYIQSYPPSGAKWQISTGGGSHPRWRRDGKELYYLAGDQKIMAVDIGGGTTLEPGRPRPLFQSRGSGLVLTNLIFPYTVSGDGRRFLINSSVEEGNPSPVVLVVNWTAGLKGLR